MNTNNTTTNIDESKAVHEFLIDEGGFKDEKFDTRNVDDHDVVVGHQVVLLA